MWLEQDDKQDPYNRAPSNTNVAIGAGGSGGSIGGSGKPSEPSPAQPEQKFASAQDYLKANQAQGETLGSNVVSKLNTTLGNEKSTIDNAATNTKNDINAATTAFDPALASTAVSNPTKITGDPNLLNGFLKQWNASYTGPESFEKSANYAPAAGAVTEATGKAAQTGSIGGQADLIGEQFGVYGQGNKTLDAALLTNSSANPQVQQSAKDFKGIQDYLTNQSSAVNSLVDPAKTTSANAQTKIHDTLLNSDNGAIANFNTSLTDRLNSARTEAQTRADAARQALTLKTSDLELHPNGVADQTLQDLGLTRDEYNQIIGQTDAVRTGYTPVDHPKDNVPGINVNLADYLTQQNPMATISPENIATKQDFEKAKAYEQLTGSPININYSNDANAGTANLNLSNLKKDDLRKYLDQALKRIRDTQDKYKTTPPVLPHNPPTVGPGGVVGPYLRAS